MKKNNGVRMSWVFAVVVCLAFAVRAATGVWINVTGGYWGDTNCWENGYVAKSAPNAADFTALGSGETITITNRTGIGALVFAGDPGDEWTIQTENDADIGFDMTPLTADFAGGEIQVEGGTLNLLPQWFYADIGLLKTGSGGLRLTRKYSGLTRGDIRLDGGTLILSNNAELLHNLVVFNATNAALTLETDALIGGVASLVTPTPNIALNGHTLKIGGSEKNPMWDGRLTGDGALIMVRGEVQTLTASQAVEKVRLDNGSLQLGRTVGKTAAWYRFEDAGDIGKDSSACGNDLTKYGTPTHWYVNDSERGGVLSLNNNALLIGSEFGQSVSDLPISNSSFTVALWVKADSSCPNNAGLFGWGIFGEQLTVNFLRMTASDQVLYSNWGRDRKIDLPADLQDGAWHHFAVVYDGRNMKFYFDGTMLFKDTHTIPLQVINTDFSIGRGWSGAPCFTGCIDDFVIADWAMNEAELYMVRVNSQAPDTSVLTDNLLPPTAVVEIGYNGFLYLLGDQTLASLGGEGAAGGITLRNGGTLTVDGAGCVTSTVFRSAISGDGKFVKRGADYTLELAGANSYTGATEVQEGTLMLSPSESHGLQAYYRFDDPNCLGRDSSGNGYDLSVYNTPSYTADGRYGGAVKFNALNKDRLFMSGGMPLGLPTGNHSYTLACWCNPDNNKSGMAVYMGSYEGSIYQMSLIRFRSSPNNKTVLISSWGATSIFPEAGFDLFDDSISNGWHHIAVTYSGTDRERKVYIDGVLKSTDTLSQNMDILSQRFWLGAGPYAGTDYEGRLDEVMVFNRPLNAEEVRAAMAGREALVKSAPVLSRVTEKLVARYSFEDALNIGRDSGPYGYDLVSQSTVNVSPYGVSGQAMDLSSVYGYLAWTNSVFPEMMPIGNQAVTISAWINPESDAGATGAGVIMWGGTNANKQCHFVRLWQRYGWDSKKGFCYGNWGYNLESDEVDDIVLGNAFSGWHHVAAVYDPAANGNNRQIYIDGILTAYDNIKDLNVQPDLFRIGRQVDDDKWFQGLIDEVEIYDSALAPAEIRAVMRRGADILPIGTTLTVAAGAKFDLNGAEQRVTSLTGSGEVRLAGVLTVAGGTSQFDGSLTGQGGLAVRDGAVLTLAGAGSLNGEMTVSNATLLIENTNGSVTGADCTIAVQEGGVFGGSGTLTGAVAFEDGSVIAAGLQAEALTVNGAVTLGATGVVALSLSPESTGGRFELISATTLSVISGFSGWTVSGIDPSLKTVFHQDGGRLAVSVYQHGMLILIQ